MVSLTTFPSPLYPSVLSRPTVQHPSTPPTYPCPRKGTEGLSLAPSISPIPKVWSTHTRAPSRCPSLPGCWGQPLHLSIPCFLALGVSTAPPRQGGEGGHWKPWRAPDSQHGFPVVRRGSEVNDSTLCPRSHRQPNGPDVPEANSHRAGLEHLRFLGADRRKKQAARGGVGRPWLQKP